MKRSFATAMRFVLAGATVAVVIASGADVRAEQQGAPATVTAMTRNLYLGADLLPAVAAQTPQALIDAASVIFASVEATRFPERAQAIAEEIAATTPDVVGLQEVALWRSRDTAAFPPEAAPTADRIEFDFLAILLDALHARGVNYHAAIVIDETDVQAPANAPGQHCTVAGWVLATGECRDIRFTDRDAILVRDVPAGPQVHVINAQKAYFVANPLLPLLGGAIRAKRGWLAIDAQLRGRQFRLISAHLEPDAPAIQVAQGAEILAGPANVNGPVVFVCDCNSPADGSGSATYANLLAGGFQDAWSQRHPGDPGYTCCEAGNLLNTTPTLSQRLDLVLFRGPFVATDIAIVGNEIEDRTSSGLWPSDHAGVVGELRQRNGR